MTQHNDRPNQAANKEPAEGSRETIDSREGASGISNRPLEEEQQEQENIPERGQSRREDRQDTGRREDRQDA